MAEGRRNGKDNKRAATDALPADSPVEITAARLLWRDGEDADEKAASLSGKPVTIGKGKGNTIRLNDPHVSHEHAKVTLTTEGVLVEDLGSRNGTEVNGVPVDTLILHQGAVLTVGKTELLLEVGSAAGRVSSFHGVIGTSDSMNKLFATLEKLVSTDVSLLLTGETGTGKDVLAKAMHRAGPRKGKPFAVFDCGAVAANLVESDLFGHTKGAFTGATDDRNGVFETGDGGTVFLDEIGELPLELQPRLLRVLEQRQVRRVGGQEPRDVDVRVIAATNRNLDKEVDAGRFRRDLYFRLSAAVVHVPALRERMDDLPELAASFLRELGKPLVIAPATLKALSDYDWPGNVRELKNVITSAAAMAEGTTLDPQDLLFFKRRGNRAATLDRLPLAGRTLEHLERAAISQTLLQTGGNKSKTAKILGIASSTLYEKIKKYGLS